MLQCHKYSCTDVIYDHTAKITNYISNPAILQMRQKLTIRFRFWIYHLLPLSGFSLSCLLEALGLGVNFSHKSLGYLGPRHILQACGLTTHHIPFCFRSAAQSELSDSRISKASLEEFCMGRPSSHTKTWVFWERKIPVGLSPCVEVSLSGCSPNISSRESGRHGNFGNHSCRAKNYLPAIKLHLNTGFVTHYTLSWFGYRGLSLILVFGFWPFRSLGLLWF